MIALGVLLFTAFAGAQPQFGRAPSLEARVLNSDTVLVATLVSLSLDEDGKQITSASFKATEVFKGRAIESLTVPLWLTPRTFVDWIEGKSRALLFGKGGVFTVLPISGPVPQVMLWNLTKLVDERTIVGAARRIAQAHPEVTDIATINVFVPHKMVEGWQGVGTIFNLQIPITEELHQWAVATAKSGTGDKARAAEVLGHFGSPLDIGLLKSMLLDKTAVGIRRGDEELGVERFQYSVRAVALDELNRLGVNVDVPVIEFTEFRPENVTYAYLDRDRGAAAKIKTLGQFKNLQRVFIGNSGATDEEVRVLSGMQSVTELHASGNPITDAALHDIARMSRLKVLELTGARITDAGLRALAKLQSLEHLELNNTQITNAGLVEIAKLKNLRRLGIANTNVTVEGLAALRGLKHLESVSDLVVDWQQTDAYYLALRETGLLHTNGSARSTDDVRATNALGVKEFWAYGLKIGDAGLEALTEFRNLEELSISGSQVTETGVRTILKFRRLKRLVINNNVLVTDAAMQTVAMVEGLTSLGIANTSIGDEGLRCVGRMKKLEWLAISGSKVTNSGFFHLRELKNLQHLVMHNLPVGDEGIAHVASLPRLESVMLGNTQITDTGLMLLAKNPALKRISMNQAPNVTKEALAKLRRLRPDIELD
jgi:internalin A